MIDHINKDIVTVTEGFIIHGCNAQGAMGSGVAGALRSKWPAIYQPYHTLCSQYSNNREMLLGQIAPYTVSQEPLLVVLNAITQLNFGSDGKIYADVGAIRTVLEIAAYAANKVDQPIYLPQIGCGLGGLDWDEDVLPVLEELNEELDDRDQAVSFIVCSI